MKYKDTIITQEQFEYLMFNDIPYEGFVIGIGYVLPEVTITAYYVNEYYSTEHINHNKDYSVFVFQESIKNVNSIFNNSAKGMHFGLHQRYQIMPERWMRHPSSTVAGIRDLKGGKLDKLTGKPRGEWAFRVDGEHGNTKYPHLNYNIKNDPHTRISEKTLKVLEKTGKTFTIVGKIAKPVGIATDAISISNAYIEDNNTVGKNTIVATSEVAGGWIGAVAGAKLGAMGGAAIGSFIPFAGTAVGGFIGAIGGGLLGAFGGSWLAGEGATQIYESYEK